MTTPDPTSPETHAGTFVVVPAYNEEALIERVVDELHAQYPNVVVVDDGSADDTFDAARRSPASVLRHVVNRGQGAAIQTGIDYALARGAKYVVTFDADGQHRVEDIEVLLAPIVRGECDITLGSRFLGEAIGQPKSRRLLLRGAILFTWIVNGVRLTDAHNGLRAFSRRAAGRVDITADRMDHASELIDIIKHTGFQFREVPVQIRYTDYSLAKGQTADNALRIALRYLLGRMMP